MPWGFVDVKTSRCKREVFEVQTAIIAQSVRSSSYRLCIANYQDS